MLTKSLVHIMLNLSAAKIKKKCNLGIRLTVQVVDTNQYV